MIFLADTFIVQIYNFSAYVMSNSFENCICSVNLLHLKNGIRIWFFPYPNAISFISPKINSDN